MFGMRNATITKLYKADSLTVNDYGEPIKASPTVTTYRVWLEENTGYRRGVGGDTRGSNIKSIGDLVETIEEGDMIETTRDEVAGVGTVKLWRVETANKFYSSKRRAGRFGRLELILVEEK